MCVLSSLLLCSSSRVGHLLLADNVPCLALRLDSSGR